MPVDYEKLAEAGAIMGSGGMVVMDEDTCMVDIARYFVDFTQRESCGKCVPCRLGTRQMLSILDRITQGAGRPEDPALLEEIGRAVGSGSLCGLGQTAPNPVLTTLRYFGDEYDAHVRQRRCPAGACRALRSFSIDPEKCICCGRCARECPAACISGKAGKAPARAGDDQTKRGVGEPFSIDSAACVKCGKCFEVCPADAVVRG
jgi:ferredoxin